MAGLPSVSSSFKLGGAGSLGGFHPEGFVPAEFRNKPNLGSRHKKYGIKYRGNNQPQLHQDQANVCSYDPTPSEIAETVVTRDKLTTMRIRTNSINRVCHPWSMS